MQRRHEKCAHILIRCCSCPQGENALQCFPPEDSKSVYCWSVSKLSKLKLLYRDPFIWKSTEKPSHNILHVYSSSSHWCYCIEHTAVVPLPLLSGWRSVPYSKQYTGRAEGSPSTCKEKRCVLFKAQATLITIAKRRLAWLML